MDDPPALQQLLLRARFCTGPCQCIRKDGPGHKSRTGHEVRRLTAEEKEQCRREWREDQQAGREARAARLPAEREAQQARRAALPVALAGNEGPWRFDFGKYRGKTFSQIDIEEPGYLQNLIVCGAHESRLRFAKALEDSGRLAGPSKYVRKGEVLFESDAEDFSPSSRKRNGQGQGNFWQGPVRARHRPRMWQNCESFKSRRPFCR